jgi:transcriptional regulator with XRE-family HTH domain
MLEKRKKVRGFGQRIKELRKERKLTQVDFGKIIGIGELFYR